MSQNTEIVALDFPPGSHGHFLEFVINKYIFKISADAKVKFQSSGAFHPINLDKDYQSNKIAHNGHFSSFNIKYPENTSKIVYIDHNPSLDIVLLTNIFYRCHPSAISAEDFNVNEINELHKNYMKDMGTNDIDFRNNWFAKLNENLIPFVDSKPKLDLPTFYFDFKNFFSFHEFCSELSSLGKFLSRNFQFEDSLAVLWKEFIDRNQGWQLYNLGNNLLELTFLNKKIEIPNDWKLQSYLNYCLSNMFNIFDGPLFDKAYPNNTFELKKIIQCHIDNYDNRW
jgi:hypothetical protein